MKAIASIFALALAVSSAQAQAPTGSLTPLPSACQLAAQAVQADSAGRQLRLNVEGSAFLQNDEFDSPLIKGYTLPGFRISPTLFYSQSPYASIEAGLYMLHYWGAAKYPNANYWGIPTYDPDNSSSGGHFLPFLRARIATKFGLTFVAGNLYGGTSHRLITPMYNPELDLSADPEAGVQLLYSNPWLEADAWVDWRSFIYQASPCREHFLFGLSAALRPTAEASGWQVRIPMQMLVEHYGGEIDATTLGIETLLNAAVGVSVWRNPGGAVRQAGAEAYALASRQVAGKMWQNFSTGSAIYARAWVDIIGIKLSAGAFAANKFVSIAGMPLLSAMGPNGTQLTKPVTAFAQLEYSYQIAPGFTAAAQAELFSLQSCDKTVPGAEQSRQKSATSFTFGAAIRFSPSFILKSWK